jgi:hypothetical protein
MADDFIDLLHLALLRDEIGEIQDVDVEKEPPFGVSFLRLDFHTQPSCEDIA